MAPTDPLPVVPYNGKTDERSLDVLARTTRCAFAIVGRARARGRHGYEVDREMLRLTDAERHQVKLHGARELAEKEIKEGLPPELEQDRERQRQSRGWRRDDNAKVTKHLA